MSRDGLYVAKSHGWRCDDVMAEDFMTDKKNSMSDVELMGLIVHSYNNYLAGTMGYLELALLDSQRSEHNKEGGPSDVEERIIYSLESSRGAVQFGKSILASIGRLQVNEQLYPLTELLKPVLEKYPEEVSLDLSVSDGVQIRTERCWFEECLIDLIEFISSMAKAKNITPNISLKIKQQDDFVVGFIRCDDVSIDETDQQSLFEPFYSSRIMQGKKDIGLSKAKGFFNQMQAELNFNNGNEFVIKIPCVDKFP